MDIICKSFRSLYEDTKKREIKIIVFSSINWVYRIKVYFLKNENIIRQNYEISSRNFRISHYIVEFICMYIILYYMYID